VDFLYGISKKLSLQGVLGEPNKRYISRVTGETGFFYLFLFSRHGRMWDYLASLYKWEHSLFRRNEQWDFTHMAIKEYNRLPKTKRSFNFVVTVFVPSVTEGIKLTPGWGAISR